MPEFDTDERTTAAADATTEPDQQAVLEATRGLLWIESAADVRSIATRLTQALGGDVVPAAQADNDALPVDLSFGHGEPLLPRAPDPSVARLLLTRHLPRFVRDAHRAIEFAERSERLAEDAAIDPLTGLANRRMIGRAMGRLETGDVVVLLDLDHFKALNDTHGHAAGDQVLRTLGRTIRGAIRATDHAGRYGGEEFVLLLTGADTAAETETILSRLAESWAGVRPYEITFSAGIGRVVDDAQGALDAADRALYAAKDSGRNRWVWADEPTEPGADTSDPIVAR